MNHNPGFTCKSKCTWCKKVFERPSNGAGWGWNIGQRLFCTYSCMRAWERHDREKRMAKYMKKGGG